MSIALALLAGLVLGAFGCWYVHRDELAYLRKELAIAQDRLVHAWREDKAVIPARPVEVKPVQKLPPILRDAIDEWDDPETRASLEGRIHQLYYEQGLGEQAVLKELEKPKLA